MALEGVRGQRHASSALYPRERPGTYCTESWMGPRTGLDSYGKSRPLTGIRSPDHPAHSQSLYRLIYPAQNFVGPKYIFVHVGLGAFFVNNLPDGGTLVPKLVGVGIWYDMFYGMFCCILISAFFFALKYGTTIFYFDTSTWFGHTTVIGPPTQCFNIR
jgi:hypothetical protein